MDSRAGYETARLGLARLRLTGKEAREAALRQVALVSARALALHRVCIRMFRGSRRILTAVCEYDAASDSFSTGETYDVQDLPIFMSAIAERRVLAMADVRAHAAGAELVARLVDRAGVTSVIYAPVIREGAVTGVVSLEHVGPPRSWSIGDRDFAASVADAVALFLEQADRMEAEASLRDRHEKQLVADKMLALSRLSRSVAHDLRNVLHTVGIIGAVLESDRSREIREHGVAVRQAVGVANDLILRLSQFSGELEAGETDLGVLVSRMEPLLRELMGSATLDIDISTHDPVVLLEGGQLEQVILNLCLNSAEAGASRVRIAVREALLGESFSPAKLVLEVSDNGSGMDSDTVGHLFEPYFSSKGEGRGIGLATVYGIVTGGDGTIQVDSKPGGGTVMRVALPRKLEPLPDHL